jgi:hypothetical protein
MTRRWSHLLIVCAVGSAILPARAAMEPDNVAAQVEDAAKTCRDMGGKPDTDAMLSVADVNGDGVEDWVVDYSRLRCAGTPNPFCGSGGCSLQIFLGSQRGSWKMVFDSLVQSFSFGTAGSRRVLRATTSGSDCGKTNAASCPRVYNFGRDTLVAAPR